MSNSAIHSAGSGQGIRKRLAAWGEPTYLWLFLLFVATAVRLPTINQSFWWDECLTAIACLEPLSQLVENIGHRQLPLYYVLVHALSDIHHAEWFIRLPSLFFSLAKLPLLYRVVVQLTDRPTALIAVFLLAISPLDVFIARDARPYAMLGFAALLAFDGMLLAMNRGKPLGWLQFALGAALALHASFFGFLFLTAQGFCFLGLLYMKSRQAPMLEWRSLLRPLWEFSAACTVALLLFAPVLPLLIHWIQLDFGGARGESEGTVVPEIMSGFAYWLIAKFGWGSGLAWYGTAGCLLVGSLALLAKNRLTLYFCLVHFLCGVLPFLFLLSISSNDHWQQRYIPFVLPFFLLPLAVGLNVLGRWCAQGLVPSAMLDKRPLLWQCALPCVLIAVLFSRSLAGFFVENNENFRDTARFVVAHLQPGDVVVSSRTSFAELTQSYIRDAVEVLDISTDTDATRLRDICSKPNRVWLISDRWQTLGAYGQALHDLDFKVISSGEAQGVELQLRDPARTIPISQWREAARAEMRYHPYMDVSLAEAYLVEGDKARSDQLMALADEAMQWRAWVDCWDLQGKGSDRVEQLLLLIGIQDYRGATDALHKSALQALFYDPWNDYSWYLVGKALRNN